MDGYYKTMCGINGIAFSPNSGRQVSESKLVGMRDILHHRGPDDGGIYIEGNIGLGHRRLAIVDPRHGIQPMYSGTRTPSSAPGPRTPPSARLMAYQTQNRSPPNNKISSTS